MSEFIETIPTAETVSPCAARLHELSGRDRAVALRLRRQAADLLRLATVLETNSAIADNAAADLLAEGEDPAEVEV
ncbi:hypothetical protein [Nocardia fluminea]|uniref:hypothetical protein n=1 Tax=Nocardia fluminea TaxID=134984 RepID=UPI00343E1A12